MNRERKERRKGETEREREREREEREREKARQERAAEREMEERQRERDIRLRELELNGTGSSASGSGSFCSMQNVRFPSLPRFVDGTDDIDIYLEAFERYCTEAGVEKSKYSFLLSANLSGRALETFSRLPREEANDYESLKAEILKSYDLNENGYRKKFRGVKLFSGETYIQAYFRMQNYFNKWIKLGGCTETYEDLRDLIIREQLMDVVPMDLAVFLCEREPKSADELVKLADRYTQAHAGHSKNRSLPGKPRVEPGNVNVGELQRTRFRGGSDDRVKATNQYRGPRDSGNRDSFPGEPVRGGSRDNRKCNICGRAGHLANACFRREKGFCALIREETGWDGDEQDENTESEDGKVEDLDCVPIMIALDRSKDLGMPVRDGYLNGKRVRVMRDTGCSGLVINRDMIVGKGNTNRMKTCVFLDASKRTFPTEIVELNCPWFRGQGEAMVVDSCPYDVILGNLDGASFPQREEVHEEQKVSEVNPEEERREGLKNVILSNLDGASFPRGEEDQEDQKVSEVEPEGERSEELQNVPEIGLAVREATESIPIRREELDGLPISRKDLIELQQKDQSLDSIRKRMEKEDASFYLEDGLLMRKGRRGRCQIVLPESERPRILKIAHDVPSAGHMGRGKTQGRIEEHFYWPGYTGDILRYCLSCDACQRTTPKGLHKQATIGNRPVIETPFKRVAIDLIGGLPVTDKGSRYILTLVDYGTRWPEAVALEDSRVETVAEGLWKIYSRVGLPEECLSDLGAQFTSEVMTKLNELMRIRQSFTLPYVPRCNGLVERTQGVLQQLLRKLVLERSSDWEKYLDAILFALRETPNESTGYSPFQMLYAHPVRGPLTALHSLWSKESEPEGSKDACAYLLEARKRLKTTWELAKSLQEKMGRKRARYFNSRAIDRQFKEGDKVLLLFPRQTAKFDLHWSGPYPIVKRVCRTVYIVEREGFQKAYHVNLLKRYVERREVESENETVMGMTSLPWTEDVVLKEWDEEVDLGFAGNDKDILDISENLDEGKKMQMRTLLKEFNEVLSDKPGKTDWVEHEIRLTSTEPIRKKPYPIPHHLRKDAEEEIKKMLEMGIIEQSDSDYCSPFLLIKKSDGTWRPCVDFRELNKKTVFDAEPLPRLEDTLIGLEKAKYLTKFDLTKGFWQIGLKPEHRKYTAFRLPDSHLYQFKVLCFGLVTAPAQCERLVRRVVEGIEDTRHFMDDILIASEDWDEHIRNVRRVLERLRDAGLTIKPGKCQFGYPELEFLGNCVGNGVKKPSLSKIEKIRNAIFPKRKKQVRAFLGLCGFLRSYIPNFSCIAAPLTDATRKGEPNDVLETEVRIRAFESLKQALCTEPVLRLPDLGKEFYLQTDSSQEALGAVLFQEHGGNRFPVAYASKKLNTAQKNYSTIEREALAVYWGIHKYSEFLMGKHFYLLTDHAPLTYLNSAKFQNARVMRWSLALQSYRFSVLYIKGKDNFGADFMSRSV